MTRKQTLQTLTARAEAASKLVGDCIAYIDTVAVLVPKPLKWWPLQSHNRGLIIPYTSKARHVPKGYHIHQPSLPTIGYISTEQPNHLISRFDLALDFIVTSADDRLWFADFLRQHLTQPWRGKRERTLYEDTLYLGPKSTRRNVVVYLSPSKITSQPAVHLELRYVSADTCRRRGVHRVGDLLALDIDTCIRRDLRFSAICWRIADRAIDKLAARVVRQHADRAETVETPTSIYDRRISLKLAHRRLVEPFRRSMQDEDQEVDWSDREEFAVQDCIDGWCVLRDAAVHVPPTGLIKKQPTFVWR
jgi:hypothetical protein